MKKLRNKCKAEKKLNSAIYAWLSWIIWYSIAFMCSRWFTVSINRWSAFYCSHFSSSFYYLFVYMYIVYPIIFRIFVFLFTRFGTGFQILHPPIFIQFFPFVRFFLVFAVFRYLSIFFDFSSLPLFCFIIKIHIPCHTFLCQFFSGKKTSVIQCFAMFVPFLIVFLCDILWT